MNVTAGNYSVTGPRCMLKQIDGLRAGRCFDGDSESLQPGGETQVFPCTHRWYQFLSFGDGVFAPQGSMYTTIPAHIVRQIRNLGHEQSQYMCMGVLGRGDHDEEDWEDEGTTVDATVGGAGESTTKDDAEEDEQVELAEWINEEVVTTQCSNTGAVIEWLYIPFIDDEIPIEVVGESGKDDITSEDKETCPNPSNGEECSSFTDVPAMLQ